MGEGRLKQIDSQVLQMQGPIGAINARLKKIPREVHLPGAKELEKLFPEMGNKRVDEKEQHLAMKYKYKPKKVGEVKEVVAHINGDDMREITMR